MHLVPGVVDRAEFMKLLARLVLWLGGWKPLGGPPTASKYVLIAYPHSSNWDGFWLVIFAAKLTLSPTNRTNSNLPPMPSAAQDSLIISTRSSASASAIMYIGSNPPDAASAPLSLFAHVP